jgi:hypothetical protein
MPGFNAKQSAPQVRTGNMVAVAIGQNIIGFAQTVGHNLPMGTEQLYGIGSSKPQEIQQLRMSPSVTLDSFALTQNGLDLQAGGQNLSYILAGNQFDIYVLDGLNNDTTVYVYVGCKCQSFGESIGANTPVRDTYSFLAMDVLDPNGNSIMDTGQNALLVATAAAVAGNAVQGALGLSP